MYLSCPLMIATKFAHTFGRGKARLKALIFPIPKNLKRKKIQISPTAINRQRVFLRPPLISSLSSLPFPFPDVRGEGAVIELQCSGVRVMQLSHAATNVFSCILS